MEFGQRVANEVGEPAALTHSRPLISAFRLSHLCRSRPAAPFASKATACQAGRAYKSGIMLATKSGEDWFFVKLSI